MSLESKIQYCGAVWKIKEIKQSTMTRKAGEPCDGYADFNTQTIYLDKALHPHRKAVTLAHEMLHVAYDRAGLPEKPEERTVRGLEHSVYEMVNKFPAKYRNNKPPKGL